MYLASSEKECLQPYSKQMLLTGWVRGSHLVISAVAYTVLEYLSSKIKFLRVIQLEPWREVYHGALGKVEYRLLTVKQLN